MASLRARLRCPHCGVRALEEFVYGEVPSTPDAITDLEARDVDRAFMHGNIEGPVVERWFHVFGCRRWIAVRRDTRTDEVQA